jgi:esterase
MKLFFRRFGEGPTMIIVHGLYGSSDNWVTIGKELAMHFEVFIIDQRNHGQSPHSPEHNYEVMKEDLREFMDDNGIDSAVLLGHSMGGKTVMFFAAAYPDRVNGLVVVDIAPKSYHKLTHQDLKTIDHQTILSAIKAIDLNQYADRNEINEALSLTISSDRVRQFLLKNLRRTKDNRFEWKLNVPALYSNLNRILEGIDASKFHAGNRVTGFPVLFIRGELSNYISHADEAEILQIFPFAEIRTIRGAGHWVHAEQGEQLKEDVLNFFL